MFVGPVEYDTIAAVKRAVAIPVIANGDIATPRRARDVLEATGADAIMIGRAAQGRPWIFREIAHFLATGAELAPPTVAEAREAILEHLGDHYAFYGEEAGVRIARKHLGWYTRDLADSAGARAEFNRADTAGAQTAAVVRYFDRLADAGDRLVYATAAPVVEAGFAARAGRAPNRAPAPWVGEALAA
jgi:tRNA-dihydrouridine synthase B